MASWYIMPAAAALRTGAPAARDDAEKEQS